MFGMKTPLKLMIVKVMGDGSVMDARSLYRCLEPIYGTERQFSLKRLERHLQALKAVGMLEAAGAVLENGKDLVVSYRLTAHGLRKVAELG
jgi:hypothetical protein